MSSDFKSLNRFPAINNVDKFKKESEVFDGNVKKSNERLIAPILHPFNWINNQNYFNSRTKENFVTIDELWREDLVGRVLSGKKEHIDGKLSGTV